MTVISAEDAMQSFIDGLKEKADTQPLTHRDAMVIALGRNCTIMMEHVSELAQMVDDPNAKDVDKINAGMLSQVYAAMVDTMKQDIGMFMRAANYREVA
jgi:hypothetical protein